MYVCVYIYIYIHMYKRMYIYIYTHIRVCMSVSVFEYCWYLHPTFTALGKLIRRTCRGEPRSREGCCNSVYGIGVQAV